MGYLEKKKNTQWLRNNTQFISKLSSWKSENVGEQAGRVLSADVGRATVASRTKHGFMIPLFLLTVFSLWFGKPFDTLIVVSKVERLTILSMVEGQPVYLSKYLRTSLRGLHSS